MSPMEDMAFFSREILIFLSGASWFYKHCFLNILRTKSIDITVLSLLLFSTVAALTAVRYIPFL